MAVIDERGRLFGKINLIDFALILFVAILIPLSYGAYLLFRTPPPRLIAVSPNPLIYKKGEQRVRVTGENLRPFMRATVGKMDARAFLVERRDVAEVVFDDMPVGTYDIALFDFTEEVTRLVNGLTIAPPPSPPVQIVGRFVGANAANASLQSGSKLGDRASIEIVAVDPPVNGERRATLRASCDRFGPCTIGGTSIAIGKPAGLRAPSVTDAVDFVADEIRADGVWADVHVQLFGIAEVLDLMKTGDIDRFREPEAANASDVVRGAVVRSLGTAQPTQGALALNFSQSLPDLGAFGANTSAAGYLPLKTRTAVLRAPLQRTQGGWRYRDAIIRPGDAVTFETSDYLVRGLILRVVPVDPASHDRSE